MADGRSDVGHLVDNLYICEFIKYYYIICRRTDVAPDPHVQ